MDRLTELEITRQNFHYPENYNIEEQYRYCFGIISPTDEAPQEIVLSFDPFQGKYIKTLPPVSYTHLDVYKRQEHNRRTLTKCCFLTLLKS